MNLFESFTYPKKILFSVSLMLLLSGMTPLFGQAYFIIDTISIQGNKWTKKYIIEKELDFDSGDTIFLKKLISRFKENEDRLYNSGLFNQVEINISDWDPALKIASIQVKLVENWFWYPAPIIEIGGRGFNEWWYQHKASLKRINLGIRFMHINLSGNQDKLKFNFNTGYTKKYEVDYTFPYLNKSRSLGAYFNMMYVTHKEVPFETRNNQLQFLRHGNQNLLTRFRTSLGLNYRQDQEYYHRLYLEYHQKSVHDTISQHLNTWYFKEGESQIRHLRLDYNFVFTNVDKKIYPRRGYRYLIYLRKEGGILFNDMNNIQLMAAFEKIFRLSDRFSSGAKIKFRKVLNLGDRIPYAYIDGLGYYDDALSGYQLYVVDGLDFVYIQTTQKFLLLDWKYDLAGNMPFRQFKVFPLQLFLALHGDAGYVQENHFADLNSFNNRLLYGAGLSLDFMVYHNYVFSCEITVNHLGETGIFFQGVNTFE